MLPLSVASISGSTALLKRTNVRTLSWVVTLSPGCRPRNEMAVSVCAPAAWASTPAPRARMAMTRLDGLLFRRGGGWGQKEVSSLACESRAALTTERGDQLLNFTRTCLRQPHQ